jgi:hypothetical protein
VPRSSTRRDEEGEGEGEEEEEDEEGVGEGEGEREEEGEGSLERTGTEYDIADSWRSTDPGAFPCQ